MCYVGNLKRGTFKKMRTFRTQPSSHLFTNASASSFQKPWNDIHFCWVLATLLGRRSWSRGWYWYHWCLYLAFRDRCRSVASDDRSPSGFMQHSDSLLSTTAQTICKIDVKSMECDLRGISSDLCARAGTRWRLLAHHVISPLAIYFGWTATKYLLMATQHTSLLTPYNKTLSETLALERNMADARPL